MLTKFQKLLISKIETVVQDIKAIFIVNLLKLFQCQLEVIGRPVGKVNW